MDIEQQAMNALNYLLQDNVRGALAVYESIIAEQDKNLKKHEKYFADIKVCRAVCYFYTASETGLVETITAQSRALWSAAEYCLTLATSEEDALSRLGFVDADTLLCLLGLVHKGLHVRLKFLQFADSKEFNRRVLPEAARIMRNYALCCLETYLRPEYLSREVLLELYRSIARLDKFMVWRSGLTFEATYTVKGQYVNYGSRMNGIYRALNKINPRYVLYLWYATCFLGPLAVLAAGVLW